MAPYHGSILLKQLRHLRLRKPYRILFQLDIDGSLSVRCLINDYFVHSIV